MDEAQHGGRVMEVRLCLQLQFLTPIACAQILNLSGTWLMSYATDSSVFAWSDNEKRSRARMQLKVPTKAHMVTQVAGAITALASGTEWRFDVLAGCTDGTLVSQHVMCTQQKLQQTPNQPETLSQASRAALAATSARAQRQQPPPPLPSPSALRKVHE